MRGYVGVGVRNPHDPERPPRIIHVVEPGKRGGTVLDALYGKAFWAQKAVAKLYADAQEQLDQQDARRQADHGRDFRAGVGRWLQREGAREMIAEANPWR